MPIIYDNLPDSELFHRVQIKKEKGALNALYRRYAPLILGFALTLLPEADAVKATNEYFLQLWKSDSTPKVDNIAQWIYSDFLKLIQKLWPSKNFTAVNFPKWKKKPAEIKQDASLEQFIKDYLPVLNTDTRNIVTLFYQDDKSIDEISELTKLDSKSIILALKLGRDQIVEHIRLNYAK